MHLVSVVIPVLNNASGLERMLRALVSQTYPREQTEIILVDNGSEDDTPAVARAYEQHYPALVKVLEETGHRGIAVARNHGLRLARGGVMAMTDSDCIPRPDWLEQGVRNLEVTGADLLGGRVQFTFSEQPDAAEYYDSIRHLQARYTIPLRHHAQTANLFARRSVFDKIGLFHADTRSGADTNWTGAAVEAGFRLVYSDETVVLHAARPLGELVRKHFRLGSGHPRSWRRLRRRPRDILVLILRNLLPPRVGSLRALILDRGTPAMQNRFWSIWCVAWLCGMATNLGRLYGAAALLLGKRPRAPAGESK